MNRPRPNIGQVVDQLVSEGYLASEEQEQVAQTLSTAPAEKKTPWYIQGLIGVSAWVASILFIVFLYLMDWLDFGTSAIGWGLAFCAAAVVLKRISPRVVFVGQLTLALSLAGQLLFVIGLEDEYYDTKITVLWTVVLEILLIALYRNPLHRFLSTLAIAGAVLTLILDGEAYEAIHALILLLAAAVVLIWEHESALITNRLFDLLRPIGYGLAVAMFGLLCLSLIDDIEISLWWVSAAGLILILLYLAYRIFSYYSQRLQRGVALWALLGIVLTLIPAIQTPGILAALIVLLLGFWRGSRLLMGFASAFLVFFLGFYYYSLEVTLLVKSFALMGTGVMLFTLRFFLQRYLKLVEVDS